MGDGESAGRVRIARDRPDDTVAAVLSAGATTLAGALIDRGIDGDDQLDPSRS